MKKQPTNLARFKSKNQPKKYLYIPIHFTLKKKKKRGSSGDIQHSTRPPSTTWTSPRATHSQTRQARRRVKEVGGVGSSPGASGSTFFVGNRPVKVCKKLALSVCEDMRLPQRSMAYGWDEWNDDNKVSGRSNGSVGLHLSFVVLSTQGQTVSAEVHIHIYKHTHKDAHLTF